MLADLVAPRRETDNQRHLLADILALAVRAVIAGAEAWNAVACYGLPKQGFFRRFLSLFHGIPSPDTPAWVYKRIRVQLARDPGGQARG